MNEPRRRGVDLGEDLLELLENQGGGDLTVICCKDGEVKASRDILMVRSDYFNRMLNNEDFVESKTNLIEMKDVEMAHMEVVLVYLYSGKLKLKGVPLSERVQLIDLMRLVLVSEKEKAIKQVEETIMEELDRLNQEIINCIGKLYDSEELYNSEEEKEEGITKIYSSYKEFVDLLVPAVEHACDAIAKRCIELIVQNLGGVTFGIPEDFNKKERETQAYQCFANQPFDVIKKIMEHESYEQHPQLKLFKKWFETNKGNFSAEEKVEMLEYQLYWCDENWVLY